MEKKIVHLVNFIEAVDTINDPDKGYYYLIIDDDKFQIKAATTQNPIEAGTFYKYYGNITFAEDTFVIDNIGFILPNNLPYNDSVTFPSSSFDLGTVYTSVNSLRVTDMESPIFKPTIQALNLQYAEPDERDCQGFFKNGAYVEYTRLFAEGFGYFTYDVLDPFPFYIDATKSFGFSRDERTRFSIVESFTEADQ